MNEQLQTNNDYGMQLEPERQRQRKRSKRDEADPINLNMLPMMALFTIILCYLLKSYSTDPVQITPTAGTQLPSSTTSLSPQNAVQVALSNRAIIVDDKKVADVNNGRIELSQKKGRNPASLFITPLYDHLKMLAEKEKLVARYNKEQKFKGMLTVIADKRIPFRLLTEVLYTAGQAEFGAYKFAVIKSKE